MEQAAPTYPKKASKLLSFQFLAESRLLVLVLANGEILRYPVDEGGSDGPGWDLVGAFEGGLEAATWSPDETLLVLATSEWNCTAFIA